MNKVKHFIYRLKSPVYFYSYLQIVSAAAKVPYSLNKVGGAIERPLILWNL